LKHYRTFVFVLLVAAAALLLAACGGVAPAPAATATPAAAEATPAAEAIVTPAASPVQPAAPEKQWSQAPEMTIDPSKTYLATLKTAKGDITVELFADKAPNTVNNFVFLAQQGFYDNTTFHRVLEEFMAQGGDPTGTGAGGPGYTFADEIDPATKFDHAGQLAMANSGPDTNGSQFFITFAPTPWLDGHHTIFGEVIDGADVLAQLTRRDPDQSPDFAGDAILSVEISEADASRLPTPTPLPTPFAPDASADDHFMASLPAEERVNYWNTAPANILEPGAVYLATFRTDAGDIVVELTTDKSPQNVNNFIALARAGYYDGTHFYQVIEDLVALGGDPLENGGSSPGYTVPDELDLSVFDGAGWLGSAQQGPDSNTGQFFFTLGATPWLAERFSPLGRVIEGLDVLEGFKPRDPSLPDQPDGVLLQRVDISTAESSQMPTPTPSPTPFAPTTPKSGQRPLSDVAVGDRDGYYNTPPKMEIDKNKDYKAVIRTEVGDITIDLFEKDAPNTVNNFVLLAQNGFFDDTTFHRVIEGFMAQTGDPTGTGAGGPGYTFADEFVPTLRHDRPGLVSMANRGPNTNGSQFFITYDATPWLDDKHTIFGEVSEGMDVLQEIKLRDPDADTDPGTKVLKVDIEAK